MADVSHELGALRFVVDSPLSSKVAMFNKSVEQHKQSQSLNPFSAASGRASPKPTFSKDEYGKPLAGSLTEMRGQKANMHVMKEMLELCQIISSEGYDVKDEPDMKVIPFGELFNIYNYISDKVVGILLRARKHKLVHFEGEMLYQRRDDDVPIFLLRPVADIRHELEAKIEDIKRAASPAPQATSVLLDRPGGLSVPGSQRNSRSRSQSPANSPTKIKKAPHSKASSPQPEVKVEITPAKVEEVLTKLVETQATIAVDVTLSKEKPEEKTQETNEERNSNIEIKSTEASAIKSEPTEVSPVSNQTSEANEQPKDLNLNVNVKQEQPVPEVKPNENNNKESDSATSLNNNTPALSADRSSELPTIVIEASAVYVRNTDDTSNKESEQTDSNGADSSSLVSQTPAPPAPSINNN